MESGPYSVKAASRLSGVSPATLRAWERRYGAVAPRRDGAGRRLYSPDDVTRLRLLRRATQMGQPIRRVATLRAPALRALCAVPEAAPDERATRALLEALDAYDQGACERIVGTALASFAPGQLARDVLAPALREVGERWADGRMSIAQERILSSTVERLVQSALNSCRWGRRGPGMVFATLSGERHGLGVLLAALIAASEGLRCHYLGPDLPPEEIARAAGRLDCGVVAVGLSNSSRPHARMALLSELCQAFRGPVWVGGAAAQLIRSAGLPAHCTLITSDDAYRDRLRLLDAGG